MEHRDRDVDQAPLICCVEDDDAVREALEGLLKAFGFRVAAFSSAEALLADERLQSSACLIADVKLGGMSGLQLQERLIASGRRIPVVVITAFPGQDIATHAMSLGAVDVLLKPITTERLLTALNEALGRRASP